LLQQGGQPRQRPLSLRETDTVDGEVVHQPRIEDVLGIAAVAHARRGLAGGAQERAEGPCEFAEHRLVAQVTRHFGKPCEELVHRHERRPRLHPLLQPGREANLHGMTLRLDYGSASSRRA
jgi:hypothetical protein